MSVALRIVLPCYNEPDTRPPLLARYAAVWEDLPAELVLVDNGSTDHTAAVLDRELARPEYRFARTVTVPTNRGYGHGIMTGLRAARGEFLAFSHADQQCDAADVFAAYPTLKAQPDPARAVVKGRRARRDIGAELVTRGMSPVARAVLLTPPADVNAQPKLFPPRPPERLTEPPGGLPPDPARPYPAKPAGLRVPP